MTDQPRPHRGHHPKHPTDHAVDPPSEEEIDGSDLFMSRASLRYRPGLQKIVIGVVVAGLIILGVIFVIAFG